MRHRLSLFANLSGAAAVGCVVLGLAAPAVAQSQAAPSQRYMTWANRPASTVPGDVAAVRARAANGIIPRRIAPSQAGPRPTMSAAPQPIPVSRGLTPASAWIGPRVTPSYAPGSPDPLPQMSETLAAPVSQAPIAPAPVRSTPAYTAPTYTAPVAPSSPQPVETSAADPMAPRRDAPIFRLQAQAGTTATQTTPVQTASTQPQGSPVPAEGHQGARYYSVHRDAGRQPDPMVMPDPVFFDSVTLDLATPPETQAPVRDAQGRRRPVANDDPTLP